MPEHHQLSWFDLATCLHKNASLLQWTSPVSDSKHTDVTAPSKLRTLHVQGRGNVPLCNGARCSQHPPGYRPRVAYAM